MTPHIETEGQLTPKIDALNELHLTLASFWQQVSQIADQPISEVTRFRFDTVVAEIGANILEHAIRPEQTDPVFLVLRLSDSQLTAHFRDHGKAWTDADQSPDPLAERGRGLQIARAAADAVHYQRSDDGINYWHILFRLKTATPSE